MLSVLSHIEVFSQSVNRDVSKDIMEGLKQRKSIRELPCFRRLLLLL